MAGFGSIINFFKGMGETVGRALHLVQEAVPETQLAQALVVVQQAQGKFIDNNLRRDFVIKALMDQFHIPESAARLLTELGVSLLKKGINRAEDAALAKVESSAAPVS